jgi:hypothetical protein
MQVRRAVIGGDTTWTKLVRAGKAGHTDYSLNAKDWITK